MPKINYLTYWNYVATESLCIELKNDLFKIFEFALTIRRRRGEGEGEPLEENFDQKNRKSFERLTLGFIPR